MPVRDYQFYDVAVSICSTCYRRVEGKIVFEDGRVLLHKRCPTHGQERVLLSDDVEYYRLAREQMLKPSERPLKFNTPTRFGCPYDCGLCPDHEQHSCLSIVEITDACNLRCPVCYAGSGPERQSFRSLETVERMLDAVVRNEGEPDVVQISGGEPTLHPRFFDILDAARQRPIRHLMVNTNGVILAKDAAFAERLASYTPAFELYLQFDSLRRDALMDLRGADLRDTHERALERCDALNLPVTLVATVKKGVNDDELGAIIDHALSHRCVRGVTFQPVQEAGRVDGFDPARDRLTLSEVRRGILEQCELFSPADILPVPCHPDALAMAYALRGEQGTVALSGHIPMETWVDGASARISFERDPAVREAVHQLFSTGCNGVQTADNLRSLLCCLPQVSAPSDLRYEHLFRVIIMEFADARGFDLRSVKKSCVHIVHPEDGRLIPFDTYNLFYRDSLAKERLEPLRQLHG